MTGIVKPTTVAGIKSLARQLKSEQGISHATALDRAAHTAGYQNYKHALSSILAASDVPEYRDPRKPFRDANIAAWSKIVERVNPNLAETQMWYDLPMIVRAMRPFMGDNRNHALLPTGGGVDLSHVRSSQESGCLNLGVHKGATDYVVRPKTLTMVTFPSSVGQSFLLLELDELKQSGVYDYLLEDDEDGSARRAYEARRKEELVNVNGAYLDRAHWDEDRYVDEYGEEVDLPESARLTVRWLNGKILIVAKGSIWNSITATYDGRHDKMTADVLRELIGGLIARAEARGI